MRTARFLLALASLAALLVFAAPAWADTISVPRDYKTIQEAVDAAARGDTVLVAAGVYNETVTIAKALTLCGAGPDQTIIDGGGKGHVIQVLSDDDIVIRRLAVRNGSMDEPYAGIDLSYAGGCLVEDCAATTTWAGIRFNYAHENIVRGCTFADVEYGVDVGDKSSYSNSLVDCQATRCTKVAYNAYAGSDGLRILRCSASACATGVQIGWSSGWVVECCDLVANENGVVLDTTTGGSVRHSTFQEDTTGLFMAGLGTSGADVYGNLFVDSAAYDVVLQGSCVANLIHDNRLWGGDGDGVWIMENLTYPNHDNVFYRNDFRGHTSHASDDNGVGVDRFFDAYPWGNFWDDATGPDEYGGPGQDVLGADGVFDTPHYEDQVVDPYPATTADGSPPDTKITSAPTGWVATRDVSFAWEGSDDRTPQRVSRIPSRPRRRLGGRHGDDRVVRGARRGRARLLGGGA